MNIQVNMYIHSWIFKRRYIGLEPRFRARQHCDSAAHWEYIFRQSRRALTRGPGPGPSTAQYRQSRPAPAARRRLVTRQSRGRRRARPWQQQSIDWVVGPWAAGEARKPHSIVGVVAPCPSHFLWQLSPVTVPPDRKWPACGLLRLRTWASLAARRGPPGRAITMLPYRSHGVTVALRHWRHGVTLRQAVSGSSCGTEIQNFDRNFQFELWRASDCRCALNSGVPKIESVTGLTLFRVPKIIESWYMVCECFVGDALWVAGYHLFKC